MSDPKAYTPFQYQKDGVRLIEKFGGRALLADEMGLGKTPQAIWYAKRNPSPRPILVVCPALVKSHWVDTIFNLTGDRAAAISGRKAASTRRAFERLAANKWIVINYDILRDWVGVLKDIGPELVILDEVHYIQTRGNHRTRATWDVCENAKRIIAISGTPLTNKPAELWSTLHVLWPDTFDEFAPFAHRYCSPKRMPWGWVFNGATNIPELHASLLHHGMVRRLKKDVLQDLPRKCRRVIPIELSPKAMAEYRYAEKEFLTWLRRVGGPAKAMRASRAEAVTKLGYMLRLAAKLKHPQTVERVEEFRAENPDKKVVLFTVHRPCIAALNRKYAGECVSISGATPQDDRKLLVNRFQKDPRCRVFIGNIQAAGVGITLTAASDVFFLGYDWRPALHTQAEDRIHRISQTEVAWAWYFVAVGTIEEKMLKVLQTKQNIVRKILDGADVEQDFTIHSMLLESMSRG